MQIVRKARSGILVGFLAVTAACSTQTDSSVSETKAGSQNQPTASLPITEVYQGTEKGQLCELTIKKDDKERILAMDYRSRGCETEGLPSCELTLERGSKGINDAKFVESASLQFPGYTRLGFDHGVSSPSPGALAAFDEVILAKDNFTSLKVVRRLVFTYILPIPVPVNWSSDCLNVKKVQKS